MENARVRLGRAEEEVGGREWKEELGGRELKSVKFGIIVKI